MSDDNGQVDELIAEYLQLVDEGTPVNAECFVAGYPAEVRQSFFEYLELEDGLFQLNQLGRIAQDSFDTERTAEDTATNFSNHGMVGGYRLLSVISQGGMGIVYLGQDIQSGTLVAVKLLRRAIRDERTYRRRLQRESRAIAKLNHPHVVKLIASGTDAGSTFLAMQLIDGVGLDRMVQHWRQISGGDSQDNHGVADEASITTPITQAGLSECASCFENHSLAKIARYIADIADALHAAHESGIVHRDVKPSNILIDVEGHVWLTDFGLASIGEDETELTETGDVLGTLAYMSPEQASGNSRHIGASSDIYSLGVALYELATLNKPFAGPRQKVIRDLQEGRYVKPSKMRPEISSDLEAIICHAMELAPRDRYATAQEFAADLRRFIDRERVSARAPSRIQGMLRWCERNPLTTTVALASCILMAMVAFSVQAINSGSLAKLNSELTSANERLVGTNRELDASQARLRRELYVANIRSAFEAFNEQDLVSTQLLLERSRMDGSDLTRSVPERLLEALIEPPQSRVLFKHDAKATQFILADDYSYVLSAGHDGEVVKSTLDGEQLARFSIGGKLDSLAIDFHAGLFLTGRNIPVGFNEVDFYGLDNGQLERAGGKLWYGVEEIAVSSSGKSYAVAERYHDVTVFDNEGNQMAKWETGSRNESLEFIDEDHLLVVVQIAEKDRALQVWNWQTGEKRQLVAEVECFALSRTETGEPLHIVSAGTNNLQVSRWPAAKQTRYAREMPSRIRCVDISSDDGIVVAGCDDGTVYLWEADLDDESVLPKARVVAASSQRITDIQLLPSNYDSEKLGSASGVESAAKVQFITSSEDGSIEFHSLPVSNPKSVEELEAFPRGAIEEPFRDSQQLDLLYFPFENGDLVCLDTKTLRASTVFCHHAAITRGLCADGRTFIADAKGIVEIDLKGRKPIRTFPLSLPHGICRSLLKHDGTLYALYSDTLIAIHLGDDARQQVHRLPYDDAVALTVAGLNSSALWVFTHRGILELGSDEKLHEIKSNELIKEGYMKVTYSDSQKLLAVAYHSDQIEVTNLETHATWTLSGHRLGITDLEFIDEDTLMSVSHDGTIRFWNLEVEREYGRLEFSKFAPQQVYYFRDQSLIVSANHLGRVRAWRLAP